MNSKYILILIGIILLFQLTLVCNHNEFKEITETVDLTEVASNLTITDEAITFSWPPVPGTTEYHIYIDQEFFAKTSATQYTITDPLTPGIHTLNMEAWNNFQIKSSDSETGIYFSYGTPTTTELPGLICDSLPTFEWKSFDGTDQYQLIVATNSDCTNPVLNGELFSTSYTTHVPLSNGTYYWKIKAMYPTRSVESEVQSFTVQNIPAPEFCSQDSNGDIYNLSWSPVQYATSYTLEYTMNVDNPTYNSVTIEAPTTDHALMDLPSGTHYWRIRGNTDSCSGSWTEWKEFTLESCLPEISAIESTLCDTSISFSWTDVTGESGYTLSIATDETISDIKHTTNLAEDVTSYSLNDAVTTLGRGNYFWQVTGLTGSCIEASSDVDSFTLGGLYPFDLTSPGSTDFGTPPNTGDDPSFHWETEAGLTYTFHLHTSSDFSGTIDYTDEGITSVPYTASFSYENNTQYYWQVLASSSEGCGLSSSSVYSFKVSTCSQPTITSPTTGFDEYFEMPVFSWSDIGASSYTVEIATDSTDFVTTLVCSQQVTTTSWDPADTSTPSENQFFMGNTFYARIKNDDGGCYSDASPAFTVRGIDASQYTESPQTLCGGLSGFAYSVTWVPGRVYSARGQSGATMCYYDDDTLEYQGTAGPSTPNFRYYGLTRDLDSNRVFGTYYPISDSCGTSMNRLVEITNATTTPGSNTYNPRLETPVNIAYGNNLFFVTPLMSSCYNHNWFCGFSCSSGNAAFIVLDASFNYVYHDSRTRGSTGIWADDNRLYRNSNSQSVIVEDITSGGYPELFRKSVPESLRGVIKYEASSGTSYLVVTQWNTGLIFFRMENDPVNVEGDLTKVNYVSGLPDRYWQGTVDTSGTLYFPGQSKEKIFKHPIYP